MPRLSIPLYRHKGDRKAVANYRPISLVDYLSKVFEKVVIKQLGNHLEASLFFSTGQFGFRRSRSTELALGHLWQEVVDAIEEKQLCLGVFLDVAAAFNCLKHSYFLQMLECLGCDSTTVGWFCSFLSNRRRQAVKVGNIESEWRVVEIGPPQGSVLGPYMFIVLMNFILLKIAQITVCKTIVYADDTTLLFRIDPSSTLQSDTQNALTQVEKVIAAFNLFGLCVNASKTCITLFHTSQRPIQLDSLQFCEGSITTSTTVKCLGLTIHENLSWQPHLDAVAPKCYAVIASLRRLREVGAPTDALLLTYEALLVPLLCYGVSIWAGGYKNIVHRAQVIQNDALRAIFGRKRHDSVADILDKYRLPSIVQLHKIRVALLAYKMSREIIPPEISFPITAIVIRSARRATAFEMPLAIRESSRQALTYRLPLVWGSIPHEVRFITSAKKFVLEVKRRVIDEQL
jgi:Reverse transcriptase (RNA-dependent DNA polymerase)